MLGHHSIDEKYVAFSDGGVLAVFFIRFSRLKLSKVPLWYTTARVYLVAQPS